MQLNMKKSTVGSTLWSGMWTTMWTSTPTYTTYNSRYPWFDENDYKKLESLAVSNWLSWQAKTSFMDSAYQQYYPQVYNNHKLNERQIQINNSVAENGNAIINGDKATQWKLRLTDLSQKAKQSKWIAYDVDDMEVINAMKTWIPNWEQLLLNYLNNWDREIFYQAWIEEDPREALKEDFWNELFSTMKVKASVPIDSFKKFAKEHFSRDAIVKQMANIWGLEMQYMWWTTQEDLDRMEWYQEEARANIINYNQGVNEAYQERVAKNLNPTIQDYYEQNWYTKLLTQWDFRWFILKWLWDAAENWDMPIIIWASVFQPEVWFALMWTDTYMREYQEAFDSMYATARDQWMSEKDAYEIAEQWWVAVGLINAAVEVWLERLIWWVETTASNQIRKIFMKNVQEEAVKMWLWGLLVEWTKTQLKSSAEEWLEEVVQQIVQNAAQKTLNENQELFEWTWQAFEWGFYNPMNLLAWGSNITQNLQANKDTIRQSIMDWAYNAWVRAWQLYNAVTPKNDLMTRAIPEKMVEWELKLTPTERARVEKTWITAANFMLQEWLAWETKEDMVTWLANVWADGYNKITTTFRDVIPQTEKIESKDAQKMLNTMIKVIESSDILSEEYADYLATIKQLSTQTEFDPYVALAIKRDFDALVWHDIYNNKGQVMRWEEKKAIAKWRSNLSEALNKLWDKYWVDVRAENNRIMNSITIRDWLLRSMSQNSKNNFLWLTDLWFGALLSSGNPVQAVAMVGLRKYAKNKAWNVAQYLYNLNDKPLQKVTPSKWVQFKTNMEKDANGLSLGTIVNNTTPTTVQQEGVKSFNDIPDVDVGNSPLWLIPDTDVGGNPTDIVNSENVNEKAWNTAQELYNQSDNNLSDNPTDMTEKFNTNDGADYIQAQTEWYEDRRHDLENGEERWTDYTDDYNQVTEEEHLEWVRNRVKEISKDISEDKINELEDAWNNLWEDEKLDEVKKYRKATADWSPAWEIEDTDEDETDWRWERVADQEYETAEENWYDWEEEVEVDIREVIQKDSMPKKWVSIKKQLKDVENNNVNTVEQWKKDFVFEWWSDKQLQEELKATKKQYKDYVKAWKEEWGYYNRDRAADLQNKIEAIENMLNDRANSPVWSFIKSYTAEELWLPPVSATMLKNLDRSKYIPVEDPKTKKVVFYKVEDLEENFQLSEAKQWDTLDWLDKVSDEEIQKIDKIIERTLSEEEYNTWKNKKWNVSEGRALFSRLTSLFGYDKTSSILKEAWYDAYSSDDKLYKFENWKTYRENQPNDYDRAKKTKWDDLDQERPITEKWKRPRATRPEAWNDVEFNLTDELQRAYNPNDLEYITQDGEWLKGDSEENTIRIAYPDTFEKYDTNSFSDRQNWQMDILSDSWMMKVRYDNWYVNVDLMYEPTEEQIDSLRSIWENDEVKHVQINILDPRAKHTVRINDLDSMEEAVVYLDEYFNGDTEWYTSTDNRKKIPGWTTLKDYVELAEDSIFKEYLPNKWEWETKAEQLATAVNKLIYRYYNDWDRYDEDYGNNVSNYANWIEKNAFELPESVSTNSEYEANLKEILNKTMDMIDNLKNDKKVWSVYKTEWKWTYVEPEEDSDSDSWYNW